MKNLTVNMPLAVPHQRPPSKYASHPYPVLVDEDAYQPTVKPLDFILKLGVFVDDSYLSKLKPLDFTLRDRLRLSYVDNKESFDVSVAPLDFSLVLVAPPEPLEYIVSEDATNISLKPINFTLKRLLILWTVKDNPAYMPSIKPLDFTLKIGN